MICYICNNAIPAIFYSLVDNQGNFAYYCSDCYSKNILDNHGFMADSGGNLMALKCECGTKSQMGQNHSVWCDLYKKEF